MLKCAIYSKTIRSKKERVSSLGMEPLVARIRNDARKWATVEAVRAEMPALPPLQRSRLLESLPLICPALDVRKRRNGEVKMLYNGVVLLEIDDLRNKAEIADIKQRAASWPTTLAAMTGVSGKSVKIMVQGTYADGSLPKDADEARRFHALLYERCAAVYSSVVGRSFHSKNATPNDLMRWTADANAYFNADASPLRLTPQDLSATIHATTDRSQEYGTETVMPSEEMRRYYALRFALAVRKAKELEERFLEDKQGRDESDSGLSAQQRLTAIAEQCVLLGIPMEEARRQAHHWIFANCNSRNEGRTIIESVYLAHAARFGKNRSHGMQTLTMTLQAFMNERYDLRYNELTNSVEWRPNHSASYVFLPLDTRTMNTMVQEAHENGIDVFDRDMRRFLGSTRVRNYSPASAYLKDINKSWDGTTDHIGALADRVPNRNPHWREWFHTWFLGMVAQWEDLNYAHGNAVVPLLIGQQGCGKSTFGQLILPPELRGDGYRELVDFSSKQEVERMLTTSLLINLDEFNQISEKIQQGFLKNLLQKSSVKMRRPYSTAVTEEPRRASFIATTNMNDVLSDPSGSRRFIVAEIREGHEIDFRGPIPYPKLYDQALTELYEHRRRPYFTPEEVQQIEAYNTHFANLRPEVEHLLDVFETTADTARCEWLSTTELANEVRRRTHFEYSNRGLNYLGRWLTSESRAMRLSKRLSHGIAVYSVRRRNESKKPSTMKNLDK